MPASAGETLVSRLQCHARAQPERMAYIFLDDGERAESTLTFAALDRQAVRIARRLRTHAEPGTRALLLYRPGLDYIAAFIGCLYAGVVAVPVYLPAHSRRLGRIETILDDAQVDLALTSVGDLEKMRQLLSEAKAARPLQWVTTDDTDVIDDDEYAPVVAPDALAFLQYTSGSTAAPKGVMLTHRNLFHNQQMVEPSFGHTDKTVFAGWLPLFHDMGLIGNVLHPLYLGVPCVLMPPALFLQRPFRWLQMISRYRATTSGGPNFAYDLCARKVTDEQRTQLDLSSWEVAFCGAEPVRAETLDRFMARFAPCGFRREAFYPCYGMAEATLFVTGGDASRAPVYAHVDKAGLERREATVVPSGTEHTRTLVGCGRAWLDQEVRIVDPDSCAVCPPGRVGEIWIRGASVANGYWNRPEETAHTFCARLADGEGPFLRTGDLGFVHDGELFITGRLKDVIIVHGRNYAPEDIELTVSQVHAALRLGAGAAFAVDVNGEERVAIVQEVEREYARNLDFDAIVDDVREAVVVEHGVTPHRIVLAKTGSVPKTSSGKVQRRECRRRFLNGEIEAWHAGDRRVRTRAGAALN